jgi:hypothetical protein
MKPVNVDIALAMARIAVKIRGQKCKAWVVKDLGIEPLVSKEALLMNSSYALNPEGRELPAI